MHKTTINILHQLYKTSCCSSSRGKTCNEWWFKHSGFICIGIFFYGKILHFFYCIWIIIQIDGVVGCESRWLINAICIIHQIPHMKWVEGGSCAQKLCNHFIQSLAKVPKQSLCKFFLHVHGPIILVVSYAYFVIIDLFEVSCKITPFILTSCIVSYLSWKPYIHHLCWNLVALCNNGLKFVSPIYCIKACNMFISFGFDKSQNFAMLPIWLVCFHVLDLHIGTCCLIGNYLLNFCFLLCWSNYLIEVIAHENFFCTYIKFKIVFGFAL